MLEKGYPPIWDAKALEVPTCCGKTSSSMGRFKIGYEEFDAMKPRMRSSLGTRLVGDFTGLILPHPEAELLGIAKAFDWHRPSTSDPMPTLACRPGHRSSDLGGEDTRHPARDQPPHQIARGGRRPSRWLSIPRGARRTLFERSRTAPRLHSLRARLFRHAPVFRPRRPPVGVMGRGAYAAP